MFYPEKGLTLTLDMQRGRESKKGVGGENERRTKTAVETVPTSFYS